MQVNKLISLWLLWLSIVIGLVEGKFKSLSCSSFDQQLGNFSRCDIKALSRTRNTIDITYDVFGSFNNSANVQIAFFKRANGWRPFLYDFTISVCKFLRRPYHIIAIITFEYLKPFTNLNHTCPYKPGTSVTIRNFDLNVDALRSRFPFENGEYAVSVSFLIKNNLKLSINGSIYHFNYMEP